MTNSCARCGTTGSGKFCGQCGAPLGHRGGCGSCGARLKQGALYCSDCGAAVGQPEAKSVGARLPWILSGLALAAFSIVIALLVQGQTAPRTGDMTMTGGFSDPAAGGSAMPSMQELAAMTPREAADRLFERAMREHGGDDMEAAAFFIDMGLQAYDAVPADQVDADLRFHIGWLRLISGDSVAARAKSEEILAENGDHLLGLLLAARTADFVGNSSAAETLRDRIRSVIEANGGVPALPEYDSHRPLIDGLLDEGSE